MSQPSGVGNESVDRRSSCSPPLPAHLLAVEIDGPGHARGRTRSEARAKERVWHAAGYRVLRFSEQDLAERPRHVIETVKARIA
jgi:very-short-patch-repair endonuclease